MTPEDLEAIRERVTSRRRPPDYKTMRRDAHALLAYVDELTARLASVRACDNCMQVKESRCSICHSTGVVIQ